MDAARKSNPRKTQPKPNLVTRDEGVDAKLEPVELSLSYVVNDDGDRTHVVMPVADFDALIERMELLLDSLDLVEAVERSSGKFIPWEEVKSGLKDKAKR